MADGSEAVRGLGPRLREIGRRRLERQAVDVEHGDVLEHVRQRRAVLDLRGGPGREDLRHGKAVEPVPEEAQEAQRGLVGAVGVVDRQQQRAELLAEVDDEPIQPLLTREGSVITRTIAARGEHLAGQFRGPVPDLGGRGPQHRLEQLAHDAVRELLLEFVPPRAQHRVTGDRAQQLAHEQGFPDARLPHDEHRRALARANVVEDSRELLELAIALEEEPRRAGCDDGVDGGHQLTLFQTKLAPSGQNMCSIRSAA
jgi:hypothetical protein